MFILIVTILAAALWLTQRPVTAPLTASGAGRDTDPHRTESGSTSREGTHRRPEPPDDCTEPFRGA